MADLDKAARLTLNLAPREHISWLVPKLATELAFQRWRDTEMIAFPGEPGRRCDTVAELVNRLGGCVLRFSQSRPVTGEALGDRFSAFLGMSGNVGTVCLARRKTTAFLDRIERGELDRALLPWAALMAGGLEPAVAQQWV